MLHYGDLTDSSSLVQIVQKVRPDEIYNLAAQSHVKVSFEEPEYTANSDALGTLRLLEAIRLLAWKRQPASTRPPPRSCTAWCRRLRRRKTRHSIRAPLCGGQALCLLDHGQLPRSLRNVCLQRHPVQPRVAHARRDICHPQDHAGAGAHQGRACRIASIWATWTPCATGAMRAITSRCSG